MQIVKDKSIEGVSCAHISAVSQSLDTFIPLDIIQLPFIIHFVDNHLLDEE